MKPTKRPARGKMRQEKRGKKGEKKRKVKVKTAMSPLRSR